MSLQPQMFTIPLAAGLATKTDPRALQPPGLTICRDAQFDELGGIQLRKPYTALGLSIAGGGTVSDPRRVVEFGDELLLFSKEGLYSRDATNDVWVLKATHLAVKTTEAPRFVTTDDQILTDRCEVNSIALVSWHKVVSGNTTGYVAAYDTTTGAVILPPYELAGFQRIRLTPVGTTVILSFYDGINGVYCYALNTSNASTFAATLAGASTTVQTGVGATCNYDVASTGIEAVFAIRRAVTTSYDVATVTAALSVARANKARVCDGPIAVSVAPGGTQAQIVRANGTNIQGDLITVSTLADVYTGQAIGTGTGTINQIAAAHRSVQDSGVYRCYAFWSSSEASDATNWQSQSNWVSTGNTLGTAATFVRRLGVASRAFDYNGRVFVHMVFAGESTFSGASPANFRAQLQNTYFLYRDDATLHAKLAAGKAGGFSAATGFLPSVQAITDLTYAWAGVERRIIALGEKQNGYGARAPRELTITFDSDEARRVARLGNTLYVTGGELLQYDGSGLYEVGFHLYPHYFGLIEVGTGNLADGDYAYKVTWRWDNAVGELDRSTTATVGQVTIAGGPNGVSFPSWIPLYVTHKPAARIAVEVWRTPVNPTDDAPFYLVTSKDPASLTNPNRYIPNDATASSLATLNDEFADDTATTKEPNPENYGVLEMLAPPAATVIAASADRLFLAGLAEDPHRVVYSRLREDGGVASFNDALAVQVPPGNGAITALAFLNETLIVFCERGIYALAGDGFDNTGGGLNYGPARLLSSDVGAVSQESVALTPSGLVFKSRKGWYLLNRGWAVSYIGAPVADFDADTVKAAHVVEAQHQVRILTDARMLVWDYLVDQWAEWTITGGLGACIWRGTYAYLTATGPRTEATTYTGVDYALDVETAWIPMGQVQGFGRVWKVLVIGEFRTANRVRVQLSRNYSQTAFSDKTSTAFSGSAGDLQQFEIRPSIQECQALKVRITGRHPTLSTAPADEAFKLTALALEVGVEPGLFRTIPTKRVT